MIVLVSACFVDRQGKIAAALEGSSAPAFARLDEAADALPLASIAMAVERGMQFATTWTFYRPESATSRDLAVLAARVYRLRARDVDDHGRSRKDRR